MEKYEVILIELETQYEFSTQVEVDEAETSENITILARVGKDEFEATNDAYLHIVHICDYADIDIFPDTEQQNIFFEKWTKR